MEFEQFKTLLLLLLPPISVLAGVFCAEYLTRRRNNQNLLVKEIMHKRLKLYEDLYAEIHEFHNVASNYFEAVKKAKKKSELQELAQNPFIAGLKIAEFNDSNKLFLDEEVTIHIMLTVLVPAEVVDLDPQVKNYSNQVKKISSRFYTNYSEAINLIVDYSGIKRLRESLGKINKPETTSDYIEYMKEVKSKYNPSS